jgi:D-beta-D-heptose 7-phosphate kinase/D-beta-D-heptose 1-phosphate adenosyltransferase
MRVVVNGCFDRLHSGHKYILVHALRIAHISDGKLLVLLNSDESVRRLKGPNRPLETWDIRSNKILEYLQIFAPSMMHQVTEFDTEEELEEHILKFHPHMIVKGNDRPDVREIVGSDRFPVLIVPRIPGVSTTEELNADPEREETTK